MTLPEIEFEWPLLLTPLLIAAVAAIVAIARRGHLRQASWRQTPLRRCASTACRALMVVLLLLAAIGPQWTSISNHRQLVVLRNSAVEPTASGSGKAAKFLAELVNIEQTKHSVVELRYGQQGDPYANISDALSGAANEINDGAIAEVVLLPDSTDLDEKLLPALARLQAPVSVIPLTVAAEPLPLAVRLEQEESLQILVVSPQHDQQSPLLQSLRGEASDVTLLAPEAFPDSSSECTKFDVILLQDTPDERFTKEQLRALRKAVEMQGVGLICSGGGNLFANDKLRGSELEQLLPVSAAEKPPQRQRRFATLLVIDQSTSMQDENRMELAKQAAKQALKILTPSDQAGILAFGTEAQWISRLNYVNDQEKLLAQIDSLQADGKTNLFPAFARAYLTLAAADADAKHMTILTDGVPSPAEFELLAQQMKLSGITLSTITVGSGADQQIMQDIAQAAGGKHFHASRSEDLPRILVRETQSAADAADALQFQPFVLRNLPGLNVAELPPLTGIDSTNPKPGAEVLLVGPDGDPLLSWWRRGQGVTVAWTTDTGERWANDWTGQPQYTSFWQTVVELARRPQSPSDLSWHLTGGDGKLHVTLDAIQPGGGYLNHAQVVLLCTPAPTSSPSIDSPAVSYSLQQTAPGRYEAELTVQPSAFQFPSGFSLKSATGEVMAGRFVQSDELEVELQRVLDGDSAHEWPQRTAQLTGGRFEPTLTDLLARWRESTIRRIALREVLILAAIALFVLDVALRRWPHRTANRVPLPTTSPRAQEVLV